MNTLHLYDILKRIHWNITFLMFQQSWSQYVIRFGHKNYLAMVRKRSYIGLKYPFLVAQCRQERKQCLGCLKNHLFFMAPSYQEMQQYLCKKNQHLPWHHPDRKCSDVSVKNNSLTWPISTGKTATGCHKQPVWLLKATERCSDNSQKQILLLVSNTGT